MENALKINIIKNGIDHIATEDLMKLYENPKLGNELCKTLNIDKNKINIILNQRGIKSPHLESLRRNIVSILYYAKKEIPNLSIENYKKLIDYCLIAVGMYGRHGKSYEKFLRTIDFYLMDLEKEVMKNEIDVTYRLNRMPDIFKSIEIIKEIEKDNLENESLYEKLKTEIEHGHVYTKDDLTYDTLYHLAVIERNSDYNIGTLFNLTKSQVRHLRIKYDIENTFLKRVMNHPEFYYDSLRENGYDIDKLTREEILEILYVGCLDICQKYNWRIEILDHYFNQKRKSYKQEISETEEEEFNYNVVISNRKHIESKKTTNKRRGGKNVNQTKNNYVKQESGKLGEKIVYFEEIKKLKRLGLNNYIKDVKIVSQTSLEEITFDGLGYDIESVNDKGEKIYIEVKCSTTNNTDDVIFNISQKEVDFMNGKLKGIDCNHCFIYYVSKINKQLMTAEITHIDSDTFKTFNLEPTIYSVHEIYKTL